MGRRGPKSMADLMIADSPAGIINRPDAPYDLTDEEADEWRAVVASMPADHFARSHYPILAQYCRHVIASRRIAQLDERCCKNKKEFSIIEYKELRKMMATESLAIMRLARSMRLTHQAIYKANATGALRPVTALAKAPWDKDD